VFVCVCVCVCVHVSVCVSCARECVPVFWLAVNEKKKEHAGSEKPVQWYRVLGTTCTTTCIRHTVAGFLERWKVFGRQAASQN